MMQENLEKIECRFVERMREANERQSSVTVAINILMELLSEIRNSVTTVAEVLKLLKSAINQMSKTKLADAALDSGCEIFYWSVSSISFKTLQKSGS